MNRRDLNFIESRLIVPASGLMDAIERLKGVGKDAEAERLNKAVAVLMDECRAVRYELLYRVNQ